MNNTMSSKTLLVEIRTEELPPDISGWLAEDFAASLLEALQQAEFISEELVQSNNSKRKNQYFATPRRLAVLLSDICAESPARQVSRRGPQVEACRDANGTPTKALVGFMHAVGVTCEDDLTKIVEKGKRYVAWEGQAAGRKLADDLALIVEKVLLSLSVPRLMRWGDNDFRFVRPVRGVLMIHGKNVIGGTVMNVAAGKTTKGHPILTTDEIVVASAGDYEKTMREKGMIIIDGESRREEIEKQLRRIGEKKEYYVNLSRSASKYKGEDSYDDALLYEVAAMCEYPAVYEGEMRSAESLPDFCIIGCMKKHQRFFPAYDKNGKLNRSHYFVVADNKPENSTLMIDGFNSVLYARLRDLSFYYTEDKKHPVEYYLERLKSVVYHGKLGSQHERVGRLKEIANGLVKLMKLDDKQTILLEESAKLCKADLTSLVVGEYPDFEGKMAAEYFCADEVAEIVREHNATAYEIARLLEKPRSETHDAYWALVLADNLEKLVGMFGVGEKPTGSKDPHGLRSAAAKIMYVLRNVKRQLAGDAVLDLAATTFDKLPHLDLPEIWNFIVARMPPIAIASDTYEKMVRQAHISKELQKLVLAQNNFFLADIYSRKQDVSEFAMCPEAEELLELGKRVSNTFRKSKIESDSFPPSDVGLFEHEAEHVLRRTVVELTVKTAAQVETRDYLDALKTLALAIKPANDFYDNVMVNAEGEKVRHNRFALLHELRTLLNCVAKLS